jgi:hypothetical protein
MRAVGEGARASVIAEAELAGAVRDRERHEDERRACLASEVELLRRTLAARRLVSIPRGELVLAPSPAHLAAVHGGGAYHPPPSFSHSHTGFFFMPKPATTTMGPSSSSKWTDAVLR